LFDKVE
jgi:hypothetical protein